MQGVIGVLGGSAETLVKANQKNEPEPTGTSLLLVHPWSLQEPKKIFPVTGGNPARECLTEKWVLCATND